MSANETTLRPSQNLYKKNKKTTIIRQGTVYNTELGPQ